MKMKLKKLTQLMSVGLVSTSLYMTTGIALAQNMDEIRYFNPRNQMSIFNNEECVHANPLCFLQVSKSQAPNFQVSQICDIRQAKRAYAIPVEEQIKTGTILGRTFCKGVVSISNMDLPFTREESGITNANDGMLLADAARSALNKIADHLHEMQVVAVQAATGCFSSTQLMEMDVKFQTLKAEIQQVSLAAYFNGYALLQGGCQLIPTSSDQRPEVCMADTEVTPSGLNIASLSVDSNWKSQSAIVSLTTALNVVTSGLEKLKTEYQQLKLVTEQDGTLTLVDMNTSSNMITRKGPKA